MTLALRYRQLIDKKFSSGLSSEETTELEKVCKALDRQDEKFYLPIIEKLSQTFNLQALTCLPVYRIGDSVFIPLPKALWRSSGLPGRCICGKCDGSGMWDTLALSANQNSKDWTRTVHYPELHTPDASKAAKRDNDMLARKK